MILNVFYKAKKDGKEIEESQFLELDNDFVVVNLCIMKWIIEEQNKIKDIKIQRIDFIEEQDLSNYKNERGNDEI